MNAAPLQMVAVLSDIVAFGLTVTWILNVAPEHMPESGVTVYVAVAVAFVVFVSV